MRGNTEHLEDGQVAAGIMMSDMLAFGSLVERAMEVFLVTLLVTILTGTPAMILLLAWSVRYSLRGLADVEPPA